MRNSSKIFICSTPIGNTGDISYRVKKTLSDVDLIYSEDTRVTSKLLSVLNIKTPLKRLDQNTIKVYTQKVIEQVKSGLNIAYCTDAGMPGISDPGMYLIAQCHKNNVSIEVLPGPSAAVTAYVASGFDNSNFYFVGFLPKKNGEKVSSLKKLKDINAVLIIYESPNRLISTLEQIEQIFNTEQISVCRELTKIHEEIKIGRAFELLEEFKNRDFIKGEIVICINNSSINENANQEDIFELAKFLTSKGLKTSDVSSALIKAFKINKNQAYDTALKFK